MSAEYTGKRPKKVRIGDILVQNMVISEKQLQAALAEQKRTGNKLGATLVELGYIEERRFLEFLSRQLEIPFLDLDETDIDFDTAQLLPESISRRYRVLLIEAREHDALVAMADPTDLFAYDELGRVLGKRIRNSVAMESQLMRMIDNVYTEAGELSVLVDELHDELIQHDNEGRGPESLSLEEMADKSNADEAPVFRLLESLFETSLSKHATDIHIEPDEQLLRIRQRVDGMLQERVMKETRVVPALVQRLKLLANLDISEKRMPQDGRFNIKIKDKRVDVRISTMPIQHGESVVMRLLDQSSGLLKLDQLMPEPMRSSLRQMIQKPYGMILVTGPTGSGKTTTLYAALNELNTAERKIITVEDPIEYDLPRVNQVQVSEQIELTFARVLRSALRQDPDVLLIGEMRDLETVQIGLRSSITGHLVLSTLHTNSAVGSISRLLDMGAPGYLLASALIAVIAQRLVRRVCDGCVQPYLPDDRQRAWLQALGFTSEAIDSASFVAGKGCKKCNDTGYRGRIGVFELLELDGDMVSVLRKEDVNAFAKLAVKKPGFVPLSRMAIEYAVKGLTTLDEAMRVSGDYRIVD